MKLRIFLVVLSLFSAADLLPAADLAAEEARIRALIAKPESIQYTEDHIHWSGAYKRPNVGGRRAESFPNAALGERKNQKNAYQVERLELASSGDMAYEYSVGKLDFDAPSRGHVSHETGVLRVWKKIGPAWKVAVVFIRPLDLPIGEAPTK